MALPCMVASWLSAGEIGLATLMALSESSGHGLVDAGNFDYCDMVNPGNMQICLVYAAGASLGVCVPSSCSHADFADVRTGLPSFVLSQSSVVALLAGGNASVLAQSLAQPGAVHCGNNEASWTAWRIAVVACFALLAVACIAATAWMSLRRTEPIARCKSNFDAAAVAGLKGCGGCQADSAARISPPLPPSPQEPQSVPITPLEAATTSLPTGAAIWALPTVAVECSDVETVAGTKASDAALPQQQLANVAAGGFDEIVSPLRARRAAAAGSLAAVATAKPQLPAGACDEDDLEAHALRTGLLAAAATAPLGGKQRTWVSPRAVHEPSGGVSRRKVRCSAVLACLACLAEACDLRRNWRELLRVQPPEKDAFPLIHFLRVISSAWVVAGHAALLWLITGPSNLLTVIPPNGAFASWPAQWVLGAEYAVDVFFFIGGFLAFFVLLGRAGSLTSRHSNASSRTHGDPAEVTVTPGVSLRPQPESPAAHWQPHRRACAASVCLQLVGSGCRQVAIATLLRWLRLVPLLAATFGFACGVAPMLGRGPFWSTFDTYLRTCSWLWWTNFLFINNIVPFDNNALSQCRAETWYLATGESRCQRQHWHSPLDGSSLSPHESTSAESLRVAFLPS